MQIFVPSPIRPQDTVLLLHESGLSTFDGKLSTWLLRVHQYVVDNRLSFSPHGLHGESTSLSGWHPDNRILLRLSVALQQLVACGLPLSYSLCRSLRSLYHPALLTLGSDPTPALAEVMQELWNQEAIVPAPWAWRLLQPVHLPTWQCNQLLLQLAAWLPCQNGIESSATLCTLLEACPPSLAPQELWQVLRVVATAQGRGVDQISFASLPDVWTSKSLLESFEKQV